MPSLLAAGATAAVLIAVVMSRGDTSTTVELPPVSTPETVVPQPTVTDLEPVATSMLPAVTGSTVVVTVPETTTPAPETTASAPETTVPPDDGGPTLVISQNRIGPFGIPALESGIARAFPAADGWTVVPDTPNGIQRPDEPPETGTGVNFGDELYFVFMAAPGDVVQSARVFSERVTTPTGEAVGQTLGEISARRGRLLISLYEFVGEHVGFAGLDPAIGLFAGGDGSTAGRYGAGLAGRGLLRAKPLGHLGQPQAALQ